MKTSSKTLAGIFQEENIQRKKNEEDDLCQKLGGEVWYQ
jgi:hypothetical protein